MSKVLRAVATIAGAVALVATGLGAVGVAIKGVATAASLTKVGAIAGAVAGVASTGAQLTAPKPIARGSPAQVVIAVEPPRPYIVGQVMTGGVMRHDVGYGATRKKVPNPYRWQVRVLSAGGGIQGIAGEFFDYAPIDNGYFGGFFNSVQNLGQRPQAAALVPPYGPAPGWGASSKISGSAHVGLNFLFDKDGKRFASGLPIYTALCDGEKAYDPRQDSTFPGGSGPCRLGVESTYVYSGGNPAIEAAMYAYGRFENGKRIFGLGQPADTIDWPAVVDWANDCDANGWRANIILQEGGTDANLREQRVRNLDDLCAAGGGRWYQAGGLLSFDWHRPRVSLATLTDADILEAGGGTDAVPTVRDRMNGVRPQYVSPQHNWQMITAAEIIGSTYRAEDGQPLTQVYPLNGVTNVEQAGELASYALVDSRELGPMDVQATAKWRFYRPGDCIQIDSSLIAYQGQAVINQRSLDPETFAVALSLKSETPGKHDFALGKVATPPPTPILAQTPQERDILAAANITPRAIDVEYEDGTPVEELKPAEDGATRGAPIGTEVAGLPAEVLVEQAGQAASEASAATIAVAEAQQDIADLFATYGSTASAAQSAAAAAASQSAAAAAASTAATASSVAQSARDNAQTASDQAQAARDQAQSAQAAADSARAAAQTAQAAATAAATNSAAQANAANTSATNAASSATAAASSASAASASASVATSQAAQAGVYASQAATSASDAAGYSSSAFSSSQVAAGARDAAAASAAASATSASSAAVSQSVASQSASAAQTSATNASTSAGQAATSAVNASTSATNASGSASAAASSASVAASARDGATQALQVTFPQYLSPETQAAYQMDGAQANLYGPSNDWPVPYISYTPPNTSASPATYFKKGIAAIPGKRYRITCWLYTSATNNPYFSVWLGGSTNADSWSVPGQHGPFAGTDYAFVPGCVQATNAALLQNQFVKVGMAFTIPASPPWSYWRPIFQVLGNADGSQLLTPGNTHISGITVEDITSEALSQGFAAAAASSASNAAASQTAAGNSASAAQTSATNAATSAGAAGTHASNAGTSASQAATSASNAAGSASTASTQAGNAAQSAINAANSASSAAGSASTAASQASLAGQSASAAQASQVAANSAYEASRDAAAQALPFSFTPSERQFWIWDEATNPGTANTGQYDASWFGDANYPVFATKPNQQLVLASRGSFVPVPGRVYRTSVEIARVQNSTNGRPSQLYYGLFREDSNGTWQGATSYTDGLSLPLNTWQTLNSDWVADGNLWWARPRLHWNWDGGNGSAPSDAIYHVRRLQVTDITETLAAASSASAAATSASQAATSANSAGSSATSASNSANSASTSAGTASSSASAASGSAANAASSASNAASNAASSQTFANQSASFRDQAQSHASNAAASASAASASESSAATSAALSAQFQGASNLLTNTDFANGAEGWNAGSTNGGNVNWARNVAGDDWRPAPENQLGLLQTGRVGVNDVTGFWFQRVRASPGDVYQVSAWIAAHRCNVTVTGAFQDENFNWIASFGTGQVRANGGQILGNWSRFGATSNPAPAGTRWVVFHFFKLDTDPGGADSYAWMLRPQLSAARVGQTLLNHYTPGSGQATAAALSSRVTGEESARASADAALASQQSALQATVNNQGALITQQGSAIATIQSQAATFEQRLLAGQPNLVPNSTFEDGLTKWFTAPGVFTGVSGSWGPVAAKVNFTGAGEFVMLETHNIPIFGGGTYVVSGDMALFASTSSAYSYIDVIYLASDGVTIVGESDQVPMAATQDFSNSASKRLTHAVVSVAPGNAQNARVRMIVNPNGGTVNYAALRRVKFEMGNTMSAYTQEASVAYQAGVLADHTGKLQAYLQQGVSAGAAAAWIRMIARDGNGNPTSSIGMEAQEIIMTNAVGSTKRVAMRLAEGVATFGGDVVFGGRLLFANGLALRLAVQPWVIQVHDGQSITYPNAGYLPAAAFQATGLSPLGSGETYSLYLENQTASGATVRLKINVPGVPANVNLTSDYAGGIEREVFKGGNPDAIGNSYRMVANYTASTVAVLEGVNYWVGYFSITVDIYAYAGGVWVKIDTFSTSEQVEYYDGGGYRELSGTLDMQVTAPSGVTHFGADGTGTTVVNQITSLSWTAPGTPGSTRSATPNGEKCQLSLNY